MTDLTAAVTTTIGTADLFRTPERVRALLTAALVAFFAGLAILVASDVRLITGFDEWLNCAVVTNRPQWLNGAMHTITELGARHVIAALLGIYTIWALATKRCRRTVVLLWIAFALNPVVEASLKALVGRPRPDLLQMRPGRGSSFPSGHVVASVGFYGLLAAVAWRSTSARWRRAVVAVVTVAVITSVAVSRVYLGVHWPVDTVAGILIGSAFVVAVVPFLRGCHAAALHSCRLTGPGTLESPSSRER